MSILPTQVSIRFSDVDMAGHVHNSRYLCYFEQARIDFLNNISGVEWNFKKYGLVLGRNELDYIRPLYFRDEVFVRTKCDAIGTKSFTLSYELYKKEGEKEILCTKGRSIMICMDFEKNESVSIFDSWKNKLISSMDE